MITKVKQEVKTITGKFRPRRMKTGNSERANKNAHIKKPKQKLRIKEDQNVNNKLNRKYVLINYYIECPAPQNPWSKDQDHGGT